MGDSLQDQLRALGLARSKPENGGGKKHRKPSRSEPIRPPAEGLSLQKAWALREREERRQGEQVRAARKAEQKERRRINTEIRKIVEAHGLNSTDAELDRNFMFKGRIRRLRVTDGQLKALNAGDLGIAYLSGGYHLLEREPLEAVRRLSPEHVVDLGGGEGDGDEGDHPVPDDLRW